MSKKIILNTVFLTVIAGCSSTSPALRSRSFPEPPNGEISKCANLQLIPNDAKTHDLTNVVSNNYEIYQECSAKNNLWIDWYNKQKEAFNTKR